MMGIQDNRFFALLVLVGLSPTSLAQEDLDRCEKEVKYISGALGFLLVIETIFCCYVLFTWARNWRINLKRKERNSNDPEQGENGCSMYTDIDEDTTQIQKRPKNGHPLGISPRPGVSFRPGHHDVSKQQPAMEKNLGRRFIERLMAKRHSKPNIAQRPDTTVLPSNEQVVEEDVGGLVYSEPYEDKVSAASELLSRNPGSFRGKMNKEPPQEEQKQLVYYHVLEESTDCDAANLPGSPVKPLPFAPKEEARREDVYYYCDSDNPENKTANSKTTPSKSLPFAPSNPPEDDIYYSCVGEESTTNPSQINPKKAILPMPQVLNDTTSSKATGLAAAQQKPFIHARDNHPHNQKPEPANRKALKPLNSNSMMNAHMIQEMKNRVANKKSGN